ncbi:MAG: hypothetical protein JNG85_03510, partial [Spirochaetaceae bacterium]|nr:hypothetical protein [Spirochaetaceae bacterium]
GFVLLAAGAYRFSGHEYEKRDAALLAALALVWVAALALFPRHGVAAGFTLKALRAVVFLSAGATLLLEKKSGRAIGVEMAGASLLLWGGFIMAFAFLRINAHVYLGLLAGLQILSAFGMVAMAMDRIRLRAESSERQVKTLEGILPICSYCKKIRDGDNSWHVLEAYIEDRSTAEFSHGICPECFEKHRPDR